MIFWGRLVSGSSGRIYRSASPLAVNVSESLNRPFFGPYGVSSDCTSTMASEVYPRSARSRPSSMALHIVTVFLYLVIYTKQRPPLTHGGIRCSCKWNCKGLTYIMFYGMRPCDTGESGTYVDMRQLYDDVRNVTGRQVGSWVDVGVVYVYSSGPLQTWSRSTTT